MLKYIRAVALSSMLALTACGADPAPGPVEQIIVREPGAAPAVAVAATEAPASTLIADGKAAFANCAGFAYSDALEASGIVWTAAELDSFIADPAGKIPGTTMVAGAIADPSKRQAVIAYIESTTAN